MTRNPLCAAALILLGLVSALAAARESPVAKTSPPVNPPQILVASSIDADGNLLLVNYRTIYIGFQGDSYNNRGVTKVPLKDVQIETVEGKRLSVESARGRIAGRDTPILVSAYKAPLPKFFKGMFASDTLHFVFPAKAPAWKPIQDPDRPVR